MRFFTLYLPAILFILVAFLLAVFPGPVEYLKSLLLDMEGYSYVVFVLLLVIATVFAPVTVMPIIPLASSVFGPFVTSVLSLIGWTVGAVIAFLVARHLGRPIVEHFVSLKEVDRMAASLPNETRFLMILLLRIAVPVDLVSYALGLTRGVGLIEYTAATLVGVAWFSFAFAYLGDALLTGNTLVLIGLGSISLLIFLGAWYMLRRTHGRDMRHKVEYDNTNDH